MLQRLLGIRSGEERLTARLTGLAFCVLAATTIIATAAEALFLAAHPADRLPILYLGGALCTALTAAAYSRMARALRPRWRLSMLVLAGIVATLALRLLLPAAPLVAPFLLLLLSPGYVAVLLVENVRLGESTLDPRTARRLLPLIGTVGGLGATVGAFAVGEVAARIGAAETLSLGALMLGAVLVPGLALASQASAPRKRSATTTSWRQILRHRYALAIMTLTFFAAWIATVVRYQLGAGIQEALPAAEIAPFYGRFYTLLNAVSIPFALIGGRLAIGRLGVGLSLVLYPLALFASAAVILWLPLLGTAAAGLLVERLLRQNLQRPALGIALLPLPAPVRIRVSLALRGVLVPGATSLAALSLVATVSWWHWSRFSWAVIAAAVGGLLAALVIRRRYGAELVAALHARRLRLADPVAPDGSLQPLAMGAEVRSLLLRHLGSELPERVSLALELLRGRLPEAAVAVIERQWQSWPSWLQKEAIAVLAADPGDAAQRFLSSLDPRREAPSVVAAWLREMPAAASPEILVALIESADPPVAARALLASTHGQGADRARAKVESWIRSPDPCHRRAAAIVAAGSPDRELRRHIPDLVSAEPEAVFSELARNPDPALAPLCVGALDNESLFPSARDALLAMGATALPALRSALSKRESAGAALAVLGEMPEPRCRRELLGLLAETGGELRTRIARALARHPELQVEGELPAIERAMTRELEGCRALVAARSCEEGLLRDEASAELEEALERCFLMLSVEVPGAPLRRLFLALSSAEPGVRGFALEALDELLPPQRGKELLALLEDPEAAIGMGEDELGAEERLPDPWWARLRAALDQPGTDPEIDTALRLRSSPLFSAFRVRDLVDLAPRLEMARQQEPLPQGWIAIRDGEPVGIAEALLGRAGSAAVAGDLLLRLDDVFALVERFPRCASPWLRGLAGQLVPAENEGGGGDVTRSAMLSLASRVAADDHSQTADLDLWQRIFFLRTMPLLGGLSSPRLRLLAEIARSLSAAAGEVIVREGHLGHHFYLVCTGAAEVSVAGQVVARLGPSDALGALALITGERRSATVAATEASDLLGIERVDFLDLIETHPKLARAFSRMLAGYAAGGELAAATAARG